MDISPENVNFPERTTPLPVGSIVLHDCDAKEPSCLSVVTKLRQDGLVESRYIHPQKTERSKIWVNPARALLDPEPFGIEVTVTDGIVKVQTDPGKVTARYKDGVAASGVGRTWTETFHLDTGEPVSNLEDGNDSAPTFR